MNIFERRYKALRILSQLPDAAHHAVIKKVGGKPFDGGAEYDAFADKLADLFDIAIGVSHAAPWFVLERTQEGWKVNTASGQLPGVFFNADMAHTAAIRHLGGTFERVAKSDGYMRYQSTAIDAGCVYVGPGEGVVIEPNRGHPMPTARFSIHKDGRDRYDVHVDGQLLGSGPFRSLGDAYEAAVKALGAYGRSIAGGRRTTGVDYWEYEVQL